MFFKEFADKDFSKRWNDLEDDKEARKKLEKEEMAPAFTEALKEIGDKENDDGEKYIDLIKAGKIEGTKLKKPKK